MPGARRHNLPLSSSNRRRFQMRTPLTRLRAALVLLLVGTGVLFAVVTSLLLALIVWLGRWPQLVLLAVAAFGLAFASGDGRELVHQLDDSNAGLAAIAAILLGLHLAVTALAAALFPRQTGAGELPA